MRDQTKNRLLRPESLTAIGIILVAAVLLILTTGLQPIISALLPAAMLIGLILLSAILLTRDQRKAAAGEPPLEVTQSPRRVLLAFVLIVAYALSVDFVGFYVSTAVAIPAVAAIFGYRRPPGLAIATIIVVGVIYLIFDLSMSRDFPTGRLWEG